MAGFDVLWTEILKTFLTSHIVFLFGLFLDNVEIIVNKSLSGKKSRGHRTSKIVNKQQFVCFRITSASSVIRRYKPCHVNLRTSQECFQPPIAKKCKNVRPRLQNKTFLSKKRVYLVFYETTKIVKSMLIREMLVQCLRSSAIRGLSTLLKEIIFLCFLPMNMWKAYPPSQHNLSSCSRGFLSFSFKSSSSLISLCVAVSSFSSNFKTTTVIMPPMTANTALRKICSRENISARFCSANHDLF